MFSLTHLTLIWSDLLLHALLRSGSLLGLQICFKKLQSHYYYIFFLLLRTTKTILFEEALFYRFHVARKWQLLSENCTSAWGKFWYLCYKSQLPTLTCVINTSSTPSTHLRHQHLTSTIFVLKLTLSGFIRCFLLMYWGSNWKCTFSQNLEKLCLLLQPWFDTQRASIITQVTIWQS